MDLAESMALMFRDRISFWFYSGFWNNLKQVILTVFAHLSISKMGIVIYFVK